MENLPYLVLAYYHLNRIENPHAEVTLHKDFIRDKDIKCRVYISEQGINGQMSGSCQDAAAYMDWMQGRPEFADLVFKVHYHHEQVFPRATVKYRKQLVAIDDDTDLTKRGEHISPKPWKEMLETEKERIVVDVRNDYEWKIGHFEGSELPRCNTFRDFLKYAEELQQKIDPKKNPCHDVLHGRNPLRDLFGSFERKRL